VAGSKVPIFRGFVLTGPGVAWSTLSPQSAVAVVVSLDDESSESSELLHPAKAKAATAAATVPLKRYLWAINILLAVNHSSAARLYDAYDRHSLG
jgi:hypothetical protein